MIKAILKLIRKMHAALIGALSGMFSENSINKTNGSNHDYPNDPLVITQQPTFVEGFSSWGSPIYIPRKHTKESYRSQQRRAKQRRKSKNRP